MFKRLKSSQKSLIITLLIQIGFLLIAFLYSLGYTHIGRIPMGDQLYNYFRLKEISLDITHGQFPQFNSYIGTIMGSSVNSFYPWLLLMPLTLLMNFLPPIEWWELMIGIGMFLGLETMYFSANTVYHNHKHSAVLAVIYTLSVIIFSISYGQADINSFYAIMLSPIAFFGWWHWINQGKWHMLATGMSLLAITHIPDTLIMGLSLVGMTLLFIPKINKAKIINALKALGAFVMISSLVWVPIIVLSTTNHIYLPSDGGRKMIGASQHPLILRKPILYLIPQTMNMWGITDLLGIIFAFKFWKKLKTSQRKLTLGGIFILFLNIHPIAKFLTTKTPLKVLQFMHRTTYVSHMLFSIILIDIIFTILVKTWSIRKIKGLLVIILIIMMSTILVGFGEITIATKGHTSNKSISRTFSQFNYSYERKYFRTKSKHDKNHYFTYDDNELLTNKAMHYIPSIYPDYYPYDNLIPSKGMDGTILNMPNVTPRNYLKNKNGLTFNVKRAKNYTLPIIIYHQQDYDVKVNNHPVQIRTAHHRIRVPLKQGKNVITVHTPVMWYKYIAILMTATGAIILALPIIKKRREYHGKHSIVQHTARH